MVYTFKQLRDQVLRLLGEDGDDVPELVVKDLMNQAHANRVAQHPWPFMVWPAIETITVVAGQTSYPLHQQYGKGLEFYNQSTQRLMSEVPWREWNTHAPYAEDGSGDAHTFSIHGTQAVKQQLPSSQTVKIVSTSASDSGAGKAITIKGETSTGDVTSETISPNGLTPVAGSITWRNILAVTKAADWVGTLSLKAADDTVLLTLYPTENGRIYQLFHLAQPPSSGATIRYRFYQKPLQLVNDNDIPQLPDDHALILVPDTLLMMAGYIGIQADLGPWIDWQARLERNLYLAYGFGGQTTLNSNSTYIKYSGDY